MASNNPRPWANPPPWESAPPWMRKARNQVDELWQFVNQHIYWFMIPLAAGAGIAAWHFMNRLDADYERRGTTRLPSNRPIS